VQSILLPVRTRRQTVAAGQKKDNWTQYSFAYQRRKRHGERQRSQARAPHLTLGGQQQRRGRRADHRGCNVTDDVPQIPASPPSSCAARSSASPFLKPWAGGWQPRHQPSDTSPPPAPSASIPTAQAAVNARCPSHAPSVSRRSRFSGAQKTPPCLPPRLEEGKKEANKQKQCDWFIK